MSFFLFYKFLFFISDFLKIQRDSFRAFLDDQLGREFAAINPLVNSRKLTINFLYENYKFVQPTLNIKESILLSKTYCCHFYFPILFERSSSVDSPSANTQEIQWFFLGTLPLLTRRGHFIINGTPRIILNQIVRSPGVYFGCLEKSQNLSSQHFYAEIISKRGPWIRLQIDQKKRIWVSIQQNKKNKISLISFLRNLHDKSLDHHFFLREKKNKLNLQTALSNTFFSARSRSINTDKDEKLDFFDERPRSFIFFIQKQGQKKFRQSSEIPLFKYVVKHFRLLIKNISQSSIQKNLSIESKQISDFQEKIPRISFANYFDALSNSGIYQIRKRLDLSKNFIDNLKIQKFHSLLLTNFFCEESGSRSNRSRKRQLSSLTSFYFDLGQIGRHRLNQRCGIYLQTSALTPIDFLAISDLLYKLTRNFQFRLDDRDDLKNRRLKTIGELLQNQCARGLLRLQKALMKKFVKTGWFGSIRSSEDQRFSSFENAKFPLKNFVLQRGDNERTFFQDCLPSFNCPAINSTFKEFFHSHQLSQFLDQSNPLAEITHKRRLSCMGTGGVNRETAGMDIRGIHRTHYGRICPIETPEGQNAGLVNSLTTAVHLNQDGFLETPFIEIYKQHFQNQRKISFLSVENQDLKNIFLSSTFQKSTKNLSVTTLHSQSFQKCSVHSLDLVAWTPQQFLSIATTCIPFIEHNDANRALMGSNMQRQALPLMDLEQPIVNTFNAFRVLSDLKDIPTSSRSGIIIYVSHQKTSFYSFNLSKISHKILKNSRDFNKNILTKSSSDSWSLFFKLRKKKYLQQTLSFFET